jgi:hypothetical protein
MAAKVGWDSLAYAVMAQRLASGGCVRLTITAASMVPFLRPGDRVLLAKVPVESLGVGDIVALAALPRPIVHRLVAAPGGCGKQPFITKGDAGTAYDRQFPLQAALGRVVSVQRHDRLLTLTTHRAHSGARILARLSCHCASTAYMPSAFLRRVTFFMVRRTMYIVAAAIWQTGQRPPGC